MSDTGAPQSAYAIIGQDLERYGLGSLTQFVNDLVFKENV
jgi:hypothetical protein